MVYDVNFKLCKKEMKRKIKAGLKEEELHHFKLSKEEYEQLDWIHAKEFRLKDEMFDVVRKESLSNDTILLSCINDKQESILFANLNEHIEQHFDIQKDGKPYSKTLIKLIKIQALLHSYQHNSYIDFNEFYFAKNKYLLASEYLPLIVPPPEFNNTHQA